MDAETIIIGQGIAGTCLGLQMSERGKDFLIIDNNHHRSSSLVAAGLYNPVVFRKLNLSFNAGRLIAYLKEFYSKWEHILGAEFHKDREIHKLFSSPLEANQWTEKQELNSHRSYMGNTLFRSSESYRSANGIGRVINAGSLDTGTFLASSGKYFLDNKRLLNDKFSRLSFVGDGIQVKTDDGKAITAKRIVFAEGHLGVSNPYFRYLPLGETKGDVLTIKAPELQLDQVLNRGFFILPLGDGVFRVGATYEWDNHTYEPSKAARSELMDKLDKVLLVSYEVLDQQSGKRPTVADRRPLIGAHPIHHNLYIFNGMGSKAVMLAPYYSDQFCDYLFNDGSLDPEVDLARYLKYYGNNED